MDLASLIVVGSAGAAIAGAAWRLGGRTAKLVVVVEQLTKQLVRLDERTTTLELRYARLSLEHEHNHPPCHPLPKGA